MKSLVVSISFLDSVMYTIMQSRNLYQELKILYETRLLDLVGSFSVYTLDIWTLFII
jgi:hypothetical protein